MPEKMTPERALIILNQCNTDGRIRVDREELKEAVKIACEAIRYMIPKKFGDYKSSSTFVCQRCKGVIWSRYAFCPFCGQAIDWSDS